MAEKVLIVDDDSAFLSVLAERMQNRGMEVSTATSAAAAMKLLEKETFDAVLLDLMMPEMGGSKRFRSCAAPSRRSRSFFSPATPRSPKAWKP
jgi:DNA-binding response OmpR family regulator